MDAEKAKSIFQLGELSSAIHKLNQRAEREYGLSLVQWFCLRRLIDMPASSADALARAVGIHPSSLSQTLKRLEKKEYLHLGDDPGDSRRRLISITRRGKQAMEQLSEWLERDFKGLLELGGSMNRVLTALSPILEVEEPQ